jgi:hypothetical protein
MKIDELVVRGKATTIVFSSENDGDKRAMERMSSALSLAPWVFFVGMNDVFISKLEPGRLYVCVDSPSFPKSVEEIMPNGTIRVAFREH